MPSKKPLHTQERGQKVIARLQVEKLHFSNGGKNGQTTAEK